MSQNSVDTTHEKIDVPPTCRASDYPDETVVEVETEEDGGESWTIVRVAIHETLERLQNDGLRIWAPVRSLVEIYFQGGCTHPSMATQ